VKENRTILTTSRTITLVCYAMGFIATMIEDPIICNAVILHATSKRNLSQGTEKNATNSLTILLM